MENKYPKLRGRIVEKYKKISIFAREVGYHPQTIYAKLNGQIPMTTRDIAKWMQPLDIPSEEIVDYFFAL